jgi:hypothetical protein
MLIVQNPHLIDHFPLFTDEEAILVKIHSFLMLFGHLSITFCQWSIVFYPPKYASFI